MRGKSPASCPNKRSPCASSTLVSLVTFNGRRQCARLGARARALLLSHRTKALRDACRPLKLLPLPLLLAGLDAAHPDLKPNVHPLVGYNAITGATGAAAVYDGVGHGTHCAGAIAGVQSNGIGVSGIAPNTTVGVATQGAEQEQLLLFASSARPRMVPAGWGSRCATEALL